LISNSSSLSSSPSDKQVVILGPAHPLRGGIAHFNDRLARAFQEEQYRVKLISFTLQYPSFLFPGTSQFTDAPPPAGLDIENRINSINPISWIKTGVYLKKMKPDLLIVRFWLPFMGPALGTILRIVKRNRHTHVVCLADNIIPHEPRFGDQLFTKYFLKPCDAFVTMSEKVRQDAIKLVGNKPVEMVPHPLYDDFGAIVSKEEARLFLQTQKNLAIESQEPLLLFFGFIRSYKGLDLLLEAMSLLQKPMKLLIAGEFYEDGEKYLELIKKLNLTEQVLLQTSFIPDTEVKYYLCAADLLVQPYRKATQSGVTPLAYHFNIPMVVTRVGGLPELVPHGKAGLVADPNAKAIAQAIEEFFQQDAGNFSTFIQEEKKKYAWSEMVKALLKFSA